MFKNFRFLRRLTVWIDFSFEYFPEYIQLNRDSGINEDMFMLNLRFW